MNFRWPQINQPVPLAAGEAHVWAVPLDISQAVWATLWDTLSSDERERADDFRFDPPRERFVIARGVLRRLLGDYLRVAPTAIEIVVDDTGKPRLAPQHAAAGLHFNVSHSGDLVMIAVTADCEVGIDVECVRDVSHLEQIARRFFHPSETSAVLGAEAARRNEAFFRCWTAKEAVLKAIGTGITGSLAEFQVPIGDTPSQSWIEWPVPPSERRRCWLQQLDPCEGYMAAIACVQSQPAVRCFALSL